VHLNRRYDLFIVSYFLALIAGKPRSTFEASKTLSDVVAMANRAVWIFGFALLAQGAEYSLLRERNLEWWETAAFQIVFYVCAMLLPTLLGVQIIMLAWADAREWNVKWYWAWAGRIGYAVVAITVFAAVGAVTLSIREELGYREARGNDARNTSIRLIVMELQNKQTQEIIRALRPVTPGQ
jgi:hypothetical protein